MQLKLVLPVLATISLQVLFPAPPVRSEPATHYSTIKLSKTLTAAPMPSFTALTYQPFPVAPQGTYANTYAPMNCTTYVASRKKIPNSWGNASSWADHARAEGITVSPTPIQGAIAQHGGGLGHVAVVMQVGVGQVLIAEQNFDWHGGIRTDWQPIGRYQYIWI